MEEKLYRLSEVCCLGGKGGMNISHESYVGASLPKLIARVRRFNIARLRR